MLRIDLKFDAHQNLKLVVFMQPCKLGNSSNDSLWLKSDLRGLFWSQFEFCYLFELACGYTET